MSPRSAGRAAAGLTASALAAVLIATTAGSAGAATSSASDATADSVTPMRTLSTSVSAQTPNGSLAHGSLELEVGRGLTMTLDSDSGAMQLASEGSAAIWDSTVSGVERYRVENIATLPSGWTWGTTFIDEEAADGSQVYVPLKGLFAVDQSTPSGLAGYGDDDVRFREESGRLPARGEWPFVDDVAYVATLEHLDTGVTDYLGEHGQVLVSIDVDADADGTRTDRHWWEILTDDGTYRPALIGVFGAGPLRWSTSSDLVESRWMLDVYALDYGTTRYAFDLDEQRIGQVQVSTPDLAGSGTSLISYVGDTDRPAKIVAVDADGVEFATTDIEWDGTETASVTKVIQNGETVFERG